MRKFSSVFLIVFLLLSHNIRVLAGKLDQKEEKIQLSAESTTETMTSSESSSDTQEIGKTEDITKQYMLKNDQILNKDSDEDKLLSKEANYTIDSSSLKNINQSTRSLGGQTGRWFIINGESTFFNPIINIKKDSINPIVFSKLIAQTSGSSSNFSETILFSDAITIQSFPEIIVPTNTTYTIEYSVDKSSFNNVPPSDITQLKGIRVVFSKMLSSERIEIKITATTAWENTNSGINELAQFFEDGRLAGTVSFDSYRMVTATYVDEFGNILIDPKVFYGELGQDYITSELEIPNYRLISMPKNAINKFSDEDQIVIYLYERIEGATVTVDYIDTEGNELAPSKKLTDKAGILYETTAKNIYGWKLTKIPANAKGTFSEEEQTVSYVYDRAEATPVTVQYQDTEGNKLAPSETLNGKIGLSYETVAKDIPGWKLIETPPNAKGTFNEKIQIVLYEYKKELRKESIKTPVDHFSNKNKLFENSSSPSVPHKKTESQLPHTGERITPLSRIFGYIGLVILFILLFYKRKSALFK